MLGLQLDQHVGILRAGAVGLVEREVVGNRQSDVIADALDFRRRNDAANVLFEPIDDELGVLDAGAARHLDVQAHHAGIDGGKEIFAGNQQQAHRGDYRDGDADESEGAARDEHREQLAVAIAESVEPRIEPAHETIPAARALMRLGFLREQMMRHGRDQGSREEVRGQHRVDDREGERGEEELRDAGEQRDREKRRCRWRACRPGSEWQSDGRHRGSRPAAACPSRDCDGCSRPRRWRHRRASRPRVRGHRES